MRESRYQFVHVAIYVVIYVAAIAAAVLAMWGTQ
jgi:hypothetical protein